MYKIIGADGQEYGPIPLQKLRQWIIECRVNAETRTQPDGTTDWNPLSGFPELADLLASNTTGKPPVEPTVEPPVTAPVNVDVLTAQFLARDYQINIGRCIKCGWNLIMSNFWLLIGASVVGWLIVGTGPIGLILGGPMMGGLYGLYLKKIRGQPATFGDAFVGFSNTFVPLMLLFIIKNLLPLLSVLFCILLCLVPIIYLGVAWVFTLGITVVPLILFCCLLCLAPGIYLGVTWAFALPLAFDKRLDFWPAMELSRKVVNKHWWKIFWFLIVCGLISAAGLIACCVGFFITATAAQAALLYAYEDIFGPHPAPAS